MIQIGAMPPPVSQSSGFVSVVRRLAAGQNNSRDFCRMLGKIANAKPRRLK
jgi:hypothetical protein